MTRRDEPAGARAFYRDARFYDHAYRQYRADEVQQGLAENDMGVPTNPAASGSVKDPALAGLVKVRDDAPYIQLYFDTAFGTSVGGAMNDEIALLFAGKASPQDVVEATQEAADQEK